MDTPGAGLGDLVAAVDNLKAAVHRVDGRSTQGQTKRNLVNEVTGAPMPPTESGDTYEQLFMAKGKQLVEDRYGSFELETGAGSGTSRTTPLDLKNREWGAELKSLSALSQNLKTAMKADEKDRKLQAVGNENLKPLTLVQVIDQVNRKVDLYGMEEFGSRAVSRMEHYGTYEYGEDDFREAQRRSGHDTKAIERAEAKLTPEEWAQYGALTSQGMSAEQALAIIFSER